MFLALLAQLKARYVLRDQRRQITRGRPWHVIAGLAPGRAHWAGGGPFDDEILGTAQVGCAGHPCGLAQLIFKPPFISVAVNQDYNGDFAGQMFIKQGSISIYYAWRPVIEHTMNKIMGAAHGSSGFFGVA